MKTESLLAAAALVLCATPPGLAAAPLISQGSEFQINTYTTDAQVRSAVAVDGTGNFVVAWTSSGQDGSYGGVFARRFDGAGAPLASEFQVNAFTTDYQGTPSVAIGGSGAFVVVWTSAGQDGSSYGIFGRRFDSVGAPLGGEFQVNTHTTYRQYHPAVAVDGSGNFVVAWSSYLQDGSNDGVFARRFDSAGAPLAGEFRVNTYTPFLQNRPSIAMDGAGNFVVAWTSHLQDGSSDGVFGWRFDSAGAPLGSEFQVNTYTTSRQFLPSVAAAPSGEFVVAWSSDGQDGSSYGIFGRRFDSAGASLGGEFQINTFTPGDQMFPSVAVDGSGDFLVAWSSYGQVGPSDEVFARRFDSAGAPLGGELQVNTYTAGGQYRPSAAVDGSGDFVVTWTSDGQDGSLAGIFGQRSCADLDGDGLCNRQDVVMTSPAAGGAVDCSSPTTAQPTFQWDLGNYDKFRVFIGSDPTFVSGTRVTSGSKLLASSTYTPPPKKWKSACKRALAANPSSPVLYVQVFGVDVSAAKSDPNRKTFSQVVQVIVP